MSQNWLYFRKCQPFCNFFFYFTPLLLLLGWGRGGWQPLVRKGNALSTCVDFPGNHASPRSFQFRNWKVNNRTKGRLKPTGRSQLEPFGGSPAVWGPLTLGGARGYGSAELGLTRAQSPLYAPGFAKVSSLTRRKLREFNKGFMRAN